MPVEHSYTMNITQADWGLLIEWGDGTSDAIYCDVGEIVEEALRKAFKFGCKTNYARAFEAGQYDEYSRREVVTRHEMGG